MRIYAKILLLTTLAASALGCEAATSLSAASLSVPKQSAAKKSEQKNKATKEAKANKSEQKKSEQKKDATKQATAKKSEQKKDAPKEAATVPVVAVPDSITDFGARTDYYVARFWPAAEASLADDASMAAAFDAWIEPVEAASADTVFSAVRSLMASLASRPERQLAMAALAEERLYGDEATLPSDELFRAFLLPVLRNKSIDPSLKARYSHLFTVLGNSLIGYPLAPVPFTGFDGGARLVEPRPDTTTLIFINSPDCIDCRMARARLSTEVALEKLIDAGKLQMVAISVCEPDDPALKAFAETLPPSWTAGVNPGLDSVIDLRGPMPQFYIAGADGRLAGKGLDIDRILLLINSLRQQL